MNIVMTCDHAGFKLKEDIKAFLKERGYNVIDYGAVSTEPVDYPDYAEKAAKAILKKEADKGIFICGTGIGISIAANRFKGIRAALCGDTFSAKMSRLHNNSNVLALGANVTALPKALDIVEEWLSLDFEGGRHERRINKLDEIG